jgi:hypothetical protein
MADTKITDLTSQSSAGSADLIPTVQSGTNKKITFANLEASLDHANIQNIGTNTHGQIDTHIASTTAHGIGTLASQDSNSVSITGGSITGITDIAVADGGTGQSSYTDGQLLIGKSDGSLAKATLTAGSNVTITNGDGSITIAASGGGGSGGSVTSVGMSTPSFLSVSGSPITSSGTLSVSLSGTALPVANGGTGQTSYTNGQLLIGNTSGNTLTKATLTAGTGVSITNGTGAITINAVNSPALTNFVFEGDSMTAISQPSYWQPDLTANYPQFAIGTTFNDAVGGSTVANLGGGIPSITARYTANVLPYAPTVTGQECLLFVWVGINDIQAHSQTALNTYNALKAYWAQARADGFKICAFTLTPSTGSSSGAALTKWLALQAYILSDTTLYDYLVRPDLLFPNPSDTAIFPDGLHLSSAAHAVLAKAVSERIGQQNILNPALSGNALSAANLAGNLTVDGTIQTGNKYVGGDNSMELNSLGFGDRNSYIDFHSNDTETDYSMRIIKSSGQNTYAAMQMKGTGSLNIFKEDSGTIGFATNATIGPQVLDGNNFKTTGRRRARTAVNANYTILKTDEILAVTTGSSTITTTLPGASTVGAGACFEVIKVDSGVGTVSIARGGSDTIQGATSISLLSQWEKATLVSDGTSSWYLGDSVRGLTGYIQAPLGVKDTNGNVVNTFTGVSSAVNYLEFTNNVTTLGPIVQAAGSDTDIVLQLKSKGAGGIFLDSAGVRHVQDQPIKDSSGAVFIGFTKVASSVNYVDIQNNSTGNSPTISAKGTDSNIDLTLSTKGTGAVKTAMAFVQAVVALTDAATIATDASLGNTFTVTLGGNRTLGAPTNPVSGQKIIYRVTQDGTGSRTLSYNAVFRFSTDVPSPTLSTAAGATDYLGFQYNAAAAKWDCLAVVKGF